MLAGFRKRAAAMVGIGIRGRITVGARVPLGTSHLSRSGMERCFFCELLLWIYAFPHGIYGRAYQGTALTDAFEGEQGNWER